MKKRIVVAGLCLGLLALTACSTSAQGSGGVTNPDSASSGMLTADGALDDLALAMGHLKSLGNSTDPAGELQAFTDIVGSLGDELSAGIDGIPADVTTPAAVAAGATEASMQRFLTCLNEADNPDECEVLGKEAVEQATELGAAMAGLVPYSSRTFEEFEAEITS